MQFSSAELCEQFMHSRSKVLRSQVGILLWITRLHGADREAQWCDARSQRFDRWWGSAAPENCDVIFEECKKATPPGQKDLTQAVETLHGKSQRDTTPAKRPDSLALYVLLPFKRRQNFSAKFAEEGYLRCYTRTWYIIIILVSTIRYDGMGE